jgi:hypothetical protein
MNSLPRSVVTRRSFQPAAASSAATRRALPDLRRRGLAHRDIGPEETRDDVGRGVLPDLAFGVLQAADVEAIELHDLADRGGVDVWLGRERALGLRRRGIPRDERQALAARRDAVPPQDLVHGVGADALAAPGRLRQLRRDPPRAEPGMTQGERDHLLLAPGRGLVGHARRTALARSQDLQALGLDPWPPAVIGRVMEAELATGPAYPHLRGARE